MRLEKAEVQKTRERRGEEIDFYGRKIRETKNGRYVTLKGERIQYAFRMLRRRKDRGQGIRLIQSGADG